MTTASDQTERLRRERLAEINTASAHRDKLEQRHGQVWDPGELKKDFIVLGFLAPYAAVRRRGDGAAGSLEFQHHPRLYFNWMEDEPESNRKEITWEIDVTWR
jgi:hypothetical protein